MAGETEILTEHQHLHAPNRFAVVPTNLRLKTNQSYCGKDVTIAFLDSGFYPHPDLLEPRNRILAFKDLTDEISSLAADSKPETWHWHGTQTSVVAAGNGHLSNGVYRGLASEAKVVLVKVSNQGRITEENIIKGIEWVVENRIRYAIRVLNISLGGDEDVACSTSLIDQAAEAAVQAGIVVVVAAGNSGGEGKHSIPPANSPSVITVGGYDDGNDPEGKPPGLYHSNFGPTADGTVKPEIIAPAMWVAAPILPSTDLYQRAEALSQILQAPDYQLRSLAREFTDITGLSPSLGDAEPDQIRKAVEALIVEHKIVATHYQHVDGTSFAAPIVSSVVAQMLEANPQLTPGAVKNILVSTSVRIGNVPLLRQGYGVINPQRAIEFASDEQHQLNTVGCKPPRVVDGKLVFVYHDDRANGVSVAGDFNGWNTQNSALKKDSSGLWFASLDCPGRGRYQYKFVVDGRWTEDPSNGLKVPDNFGGLNSVLFIE